MTSEISAVEDEENVNQTDLKNLKTVIQSRPTAYKEYFENIDRFIKSTLGEEAANLYEIIIGDPVEVAKKTSVMKPLDEDPPATDQGES